MSNPRGKRRPNGQVRRGQVITTFGPGSLIDLPDHSAVIGGLEHWLDRGEEIAEPRLVEWLRKFFDCSRLTLHAPPRDDPDPTSTRLTGITAWQFPEWFITQDVHRDPAGRTTRSRRLLPLSALKKNGKYLDEDRKDRPVLPVRFVRACRRGHLGDIDWRGFLHRGVKGCLRPLWLDERGTSGDLSEVWVRCECGLDRPIVEATHPEKRALGVCDGSRPWLGKYAREPRGCDEPNRLLIRTASNSYFAQTMKVISLPGKDEDLAAAVDQVWEHYLSHVEDLDDLRHERKKKPAVKAALGAYSDDEVFQEILSRRGGPAPARTSPKMAEVEVLAACEAEVGNDRPDGDFYARALPDLDRAAPGMRAVERVVLVHRLREVIAQVGFTRFEPAAPRTDGELEMGVELAPLAAEPSWLPAVENRGEGVFLRFSADAIGEWLGRPEVVERGRRLLKGFDCWKKDHDKSRREFPTLPYIMLHSLAHLLITAMALECGYPSGSIRERIYAESPHYGILLYTGSPDAEGTLGGLVEAGRRIGRHLPAALGLGGLCSNDPVCAQHGPEDEHECRFLHGAACHGCLLIAETSCEQFNDFLDRALVVATVDGLGAEFFRPGDR